MTINTQAKARPRHNSDVRLFVEFDVSKADDEQRMVYGYASTSSLDNQGERITKAAMQSALPDYMRFANIREMHQPSAVGTAEEATVDDTGIYIGAKIVDDSAWKKVKAGVYKGFSLGGKAVTKADGVISAMRLSEISLVDRPANPECVIELWKGEDMGVNTEAARAAVEALAELLDKGAVDPQALLAFAKGEHGAALAAAPTAAATESTAAANVAAPASTTETVVKSDTQAAVVDPAPAVAASGNSAATVAAEQPPAGAAAATVAPGATHAPAAAGTPADTASAAPAAPAVAKTDEPAADGTKIAKGLGSLAQFAQLVKQLGYLTQNQNDETKREGDKSVVSTMMHDMLVQGGRILVAMAQEETAEIAANTDPAKPDPDMSYVSPAMPMAYAAKTGDLAKAAPAADLAKLEGELTAAKAERDEAIAKAAQLEGDVASLAKSVGELKALFDKLPRPERGRLLVISKAQDVTLEDAPAPADDAPIKKADGSLDHEAMAAREIRKVHAAGGTPLVRR